ncbi:hypothetical protein ACMT4L_19025 [Deinococcus sp. A31D244]|uniref:hypothetical protein n=1 Tax=Deinococcus sp. A31D244 TaxID=3397675 RepID=UPI0039DFA961
MTDVPKPFELYTDALNTMRATVVDTPLVPVVCAVTFGQARLHGLTRLQVSLDGMLNTAALLADGAFRALLGPLDPGDVDTTTLHFTFDFVILQSRWAVTGTDVGTAARLHETGPLSDRARAATSSLIPDWREPLLIGTDVVHPAGPGRDLY